jgi:hypothetical protein
LLQLDDEGEDEDEEEDGDGGNCIYDRWLNSATASLILVQARTNLILSIARVFDEPSG